MARIRLEGARRSGRAGWLALLGVVLVPLVIGGVLVAGLWKPADRLDQVTAAVVNNDEPVEVNGQTIPLGRLLAGGLVTGGDTDIPQGQVASVSHSNTKTNFNWVLTDADDAQQGIEDGAYATVVTIPEDFSKAATSYSGDPADAVKATVDIQTSDRSKLVDSAVAQTVTSTAISLLNEQLTTTYLENIYVGFNTLSEGITSAADGASSLADGVSQLATGTAGLADGVGQLASGTSELAGGIGQLGSGASELAGGIGQLGAGASGLADGVGQLADGAGGLASGLTQFAQQTEEGARQAAEGVPAAQQFADGLGALADAGALLGGGATVAATYADDAASLTQSIAVQIGALLEECSITPSVNCAQIQSIAQSFGILAPTPPETSLLYLTGASAAATSSLDSGLNVGQGGQPSFVDGLDQAAQGSQQLVVGVEASAAGLATIAENLYTVAGGAGQLAGGAQTAADGAQQLATGAQGAAGGASQLAQGAQTAAGGAAQLAEGAGTAADGAGQLAEGAAAAASGASELADGLQQAGEGIPSYTTSEGERLAGVVTQPVTAAANSDDLFGPSGIPFFSALALWIGALATFLVLAAVPHRTLGSTRSPLTLAVQAALPGVLIGVVQGLALGVPLSFLLGLSAGAGASFVAFTVLVAVVFALVNQGIVALFGGVGRFVAMVVATLGLAVSVVSTVPPVFEWLVSLLPVSAAFTGGQMIVTGTPGVGRMAGVLVIWGLAGLGLTVAGVVRRRTLSIRRVATALPELS